MQKISGKPGQEPTKNRNLLAVVSDRYVTLALHFHGTRLHVSRIVESPDRVVHLLADSWTSHDRLAELVQRKQGASLLLEW